MESENLKEIGIKYRNRSCARAIKKQEPASGSNFGAAGDGDEKNKASFNHNIRRRRYEKTAEKGIPPPAQCK